MATYTVQAGDTLGKIAKKFYGDARRFSLIVSANLIANPDQLTVGEELIIPDVPTSASGEPAPAGMPSFAVTTAVAAASPTAKLNEQRLAQVHPLLAIRGRCMIELCAYTGIAVLVTQGLRSWEEQDALYAKGRTVPPIGKKHIVTKAKGGQSYHNFGLAFDIVVLDAVGKADWDVDHPGWKKAGELGKSVGLDWGGDWKSFKDLPHFQYTGGMTLEECRELFPSGLPAIWSEVS
ncbi:MAG: LysM peptidoglycan-binding domain-containing protein [Nitrospirae bacterium]|nr:MAG: LysM peptidoglycan-binding domain-containing protein [Nitrospirota bacterium]